MTTDNNPACQVCGLGLEECLNCAYCRALVSLYPLPAFRVQDQIGEIERGDSEADWQEACNPNEGSK